MSETTPLTNYVLQPEPHPELEKLAGGVPTEQIFQELEAGARFVVYQYTISLLVVTIRRNSRVVYVRPGQSAVVRGLPYTLLTLALGWWGLPWGLIRTPQALFKNLRGGEDVTYHFTPLVRPKKISRMQDLA